MINYYILVSNYEEGLAVHELLDNNNIRNRIAPTPTKIRGHAGCGMCVLIREEEIEAVRACFEENTPVYKDIVPLEGQLRSRRDQYC